MNQTQPPRSSLRQVRILLWLLVALAAIGFGALLVVRGGEADAPPSASARAGFGGPFTLTDGSGKRFSSAALAGKPYAIFFGFTRCGDVCPTTLARLVRLRREAAGSDQAMHILFITIDPENDGPKEVGQYAALFNSPIIGLTGSEAEIDDIKKRYGIHAAPVAHAPKGQEMEHTGTVLLFDRSGNLAGTVSPGDGEAEALAKFRKLVA